MREIKRWGRGRENGGVRITYDGTGKANFSTISKGLEPPSAITVSRSLSTVSWI